MSELKYKVGDRVILEAEVYETDCEDRVFPYALKVGNDRRWVQKGFVEHSGVSKPKPQVSQAVMNLYELSPNYSLFVVLNEIVERKSKLTKDIHNWLYESREKQSERSLAIATLWCKGPEAVEVIKEKRYRVKFKAANQTLIDFKGKLVFAIVVDGYKYRFTKAELEKAGFGGVFDNPMFEVEEVVDD